VYSTIVQQDDSVWKFL